jgi:hypothetical protein
MTTAAKPRRSWLQFSLKGLFVLVVIAAVPCGWLKWKLDRKATERAAVAEIREAGGEVWYDWEVAHVRNPRGAQWLRRLFGDDFFSNVVKVGLLAPPAFLTFASDSIACRARSGGGKKQQSVRSAGPSTILTRGSARCGCRFHAHATTPRSIDHRGQVAASTGGTSGRRTNLIGRR